MNFDTDRPQNSGSLVPSIDVTTLKSMRDNQTSFTLIDVREPEEISICQIQNSVSIPLGQLESSLGSLDPAISYVVYCKKGGRSAIAVKQMIDRGFDNVKNLEGGILQWAESIEPHLSIY